MGKLMGVEQLFEGRHFDREVIILCVRWYLRFKLSLRDLVEMMAERGLSLAPVASVVSKGLLRSRPGDKFMLVRSGAGDAAAVQVTGGSGAHGGFVQGATALKGDLAEHATPAFGSSLAPAGESVAEKRAEARMKSYVGEACRECGNFTMVRNGTCLKCDTCGATTGCS